MSSRISNGRLLESSGRLVELLYRTSPIAEDLAEYNLANITYISVLRLPVSIFFVYTMTRVAQISLNAVFLY